MADSLLMSLHYFEKTNLMKVKNDDKKKDKKDKNEQKKKQNTAETEEEDLDK